MELRDLAPAGIALVIAGIVFTIGGDILTQLSNSYAANDTAKYVANYSLDGTKELASWLPTIGLVIAAGIVIGIVIASFAFRE